MPETSPAQGTLKRLIEAEDQAGQILKAAEESAQETVDKAREQAGQHLRRSAARQAALLDESTLTWAVLANTKGYKGKADGNDEEGWTQLPNGNILTVDTYWPASLFYNPVGKNSEIYDPATGSWTSAGSTVQQLWDSRAACGDKTTNEVGPAALLPNGDVLIDTNPGYGNSLSTLCEFTGSGYLPSIPQPAGLNPSNTGGARMLVTAQHFARTHSFSTMAVATGNELVSCEFDELAGTKGGDSTMVVIANGIPSEPVGIIIRQKS